MAKIKNEKFSPFDDRLNSHKKDDFDNHWESYLEQQIPKSKKIVARNFLLPFFHILKTSPQINILDAGCGDGVHARVIQERQEYNSTINYCGIDISFTALKIAYSRISGSKRYSFNLADVGTLPFKDSSFDVTFSFGVLAYSDAPQNSFMELCRVTKKGGLVGLWIYPKVEGLKGLVFNFIRKSCQITGTIGTRIIADLIVPFLGFLPTRSEMNLTNSTWKQCREIVLINIAPKQLFFLRQEEVEQWFVDNNIEIIKTDEENSITMWGRKE